LAIVIIVCGLPGVGKTTLVKDLAPRMRAVILSTDKIRKELIPRPKYDWKERKLIYDIVILFAKYLSEAGVNCILDATLIKERSRQEIKKELDLITKNIHIIECVCPEDIIIKRLKRRRNNYSDADISVYKKMKKIYEPVKEKHITVDTSKISKKDVIYIANQILNNE
jgi:predicted kinase